MAINTTISTQGTTYLNKTYYDRNLLENAKTKFVHASYGQKKRIPKNSGDNVEFRRWTPFDPTALMSGLTEGVTPESQEVKQSRVTAKCRQYGAYVEVSDLLKTTAYDDVVEGATDLLGEQLGTAIEWITRDAMCEGTNVLYPNGKTDRSELVATDKLTFADIRKAVRFLKKKKARTFTREGGKAHFVAIVSPDAVYDLQDDDAWEKVSDYSNREAVYSGEIGRMFGVVFVESTEAKVYTQSVLNAVNAATTSSLTFVLKNAPTDAEVRFLSTPGNKIKIGNTEHTLAAESPYNKATQTVTLAAAASLTENAIVYSEDAGAANETTKAAPDVHATLVFGADAYGIIDIDGSGTIETIIKGLGSGGTSDPLDQRATVGAKVAAYTAKILNGDWIVRIEHGVSA